MRICPVCNRTFVPRSHNHKICSEQCSTKKKTDAQRRKRAEDNAETAAWLQTIALEMRREEERIAELNRPKLPSPCCRLCPGKVDRYGRCARGHQN